MNLMKNKGLLIIVFLVFQMLGSSAFAVNIPDSFDSIECDNAVQSLIGAFAENPEDINREIDSVGAEALLECAATKIGTTRLDKVFLSVLGDGGEIPYAMARTLISDENYNDVIAELQESAPEFEKNENLSDLLVSFNYIVNQVLIFLASLFFIFYLINTAHDGSLFGESYNTFWKIMRFVFVIVLMAPVEALNNFSIMQGIVFLIIAIAIYSATFIWYSLLFSEAIFAVDYEGVKNSERPQVYSGVIEAIDKNVMIHVCDIQNRKETILSKYPLSGMNQNNIQNNKFSQCLERMDPSFSERMKGTEQDSKIFKPKNLFVTEKCGFDDFVDVSQDLSCGRLAFSISSTTGAKEVDNFISNAYFESEMGDPFQDRIREVAENVIALNCLENAGGYITDRANYMKKCAIYKDDFTYNSEGKVISYAENPVDYTAESVKIEIQDLRTELFDDLSSIANQQMRLNGTVDLSKRIANLINAGFLGSVGYISENGKKYATAKSTYQAAFGSYKILYSKNIEEDMSSIVEDEEASGSVENTLTLGQMDRALGIIGERATEESGLIEDMFSALFIGAKKIQEFNNTSVNKDQRNSELDCLDDFNLCAVVSLNPINDITKTGIEIADAVQMWTLLFSGIEFASDQIYKGADDSNFAVKLPMLIINATSGLLAGILMAQMLIGYLMIYAIPVIIFVFFIGVLISWVISAFEAIIIINFWLILHLFPSKDEGFAGQAKRGYNLLLTLLIKPSFMVIGLFVAFVMSSIMVAFLNVTFGIVISTFSIFNSPDSYIAWVYNVVIDMLYFIALFYVCFRACKSIYKVPRSLISWVGLDDDTASGSFSNIFEEYKGMVMMNIKRYLVIF
jgi:conjugal transfer/type IV secretion protein DotA/TraY